MGAGETGDHDCEEFEQPHVDTSWVECDGITSELEVLSDSAANAFGVTDYAFETANASFAALIDFQTLPPNDDWANSELAALPGVTTHTTESQGLRAGYFSRVCCPQDVTLDPDRPLPDGPIPNPSCSDPGYTLNEVPAAWCMPFDSAGLCVFPCRVDNDCPFPAGEFCDLTMPDPFGAGPGTCRYKSMPTVPTDETDIGGSPNVIDLVVQARASGELAEHDTISSFLETINRKANP